MGTEANDAHRALVMAIEQAEARVATYRARCEPALHAVLCDAIPIVALRQLIAAYALAPGS